MRHQNIFNQIIEFYDYAQKLVLLIDDKKITDEFLAEIAILIEMLEIGADSLTNNLIELVQSNSAIEFETNCQKILDKIIEQITKIETQIEANQSA